MDNVLIRIGGLRSVSTSMSDLKRENDCLT